jgi:hypothetical protein
MKHTPYKDMTPEQKAKAKAAVKRYQAAHPEVRAAWLKKNRESLRETAARWRKNHPEEYAATRKRYRDKPSTKEKNQKACREYMRGRSPEWRRERKLKHVYNLTPAQYNAMFAAQNGVCAICEEPETTIDKRTGKPRHLAVDHCHETRRVRGLLCGTCNRAVGYMRDNPARLRKAASYLER